MMYYGIIVINVFCLSFIRFMEVFISVVGCPVSQETISSSLLHYKLLSVYIKKKNALQWDRAFEADTNKRNNNYNTVINKDVWKHFQIKE